MRLLLRTVYETAPDGQSSPVLTADLIRSLVAPRKVQFYDGLNLPDLSAFRSERIEMLPMFFEKLIEQHRVHRFVTN